MKNLILIIMIIGCAFLTGCATQIQVDSLQAELDIQTENLLVVRDAILVLKKESETYRQAILVLESSLTEYEKEVLEKFKQVLDGMLIIAEQVDTNTEDIKEIKDTLISVAQILDMSRKIVKVFDERQKELTEKIDRLEQVLKELAEGRF